MTFGKVKRTGIICFAMAILFNLGNIAFADDVRTVKCNSLDIELVVYDSGKIEPSEAVFELSGIDGKLISNAKVSIGTNIDNHLWLKFNTPEFETGTKFKLKATDGISYFKYYGKLYALGESTEITTYAEKDKEGGLVITPTILGVVPFIQDFDTGSKMCDTVNCHFDISGEPTDENGRLVFTLYDINDKWLAEKVVYNAEKSVDVTFDVDNYFTGKSFKVKVSGEFGTVRYYDDTYKSNDKIKLDTYAMLDESGNKVSGNSFLLGIRYENYGGMTDNDWMITAEGFVNENNIKSNTNYMVWVSRSNYMVSVFERNGEIWNCISAFPCAVGAAGTPTILGEFRYYAYNSRWNYNGYWVGPCMLFQGGYAIHSVLMRDENTEFDGRTGVQLSHGCVRVKYQNAVWLSKILPIGSKVYVTI